MQNYIYIYIYMFFFFLLKLYQSDFVKKIWKINIYNAIIAWFCPACSHINMASEFAHYSVE